MRLPHRSRRPHRSPLTLEQLEDRTLLAGNLLITAQVPGQSAYNLMQYNQQGALVSSQPIPPAPGSTDLPDARGLSVDPSGNVDVYDGTFMPSLATLSAATNTWSFQTLPGWSTVNNLSYGEVAAYKNFVFASDMFTFNGGEPNGIVRFDNSGGPPVRFAQGTDFLQVTLGLDGQLYGLGGNGSVHVFNPDTLAPVRTFSLTGGPDSDIRGIAVDSSGQVFAATLGGYVAKYDSSGQYQSSIQLKNQNGFGENLINLALDKDGQIAVGGRFGEIYLTDESLVSPTTIQTGQWTVFVTFDHYIGVATKATTTLGSLSSPTVIVGSPTTTLTGAISSSSSALPVGQEVTVQIVGANGPLASGSGTIGSDGSFSATLDTSTLPVGSYTIQYAYAGDANFSASKGTGTLTVTYAVNPLYDVSKPVHAGAALPIKIQVADAAGNDLSSADLTVTAIALVDANGNTFTPQAKGNANPGNVFRQVGHGYQYNLDTAGLTAGTYTLLVRVGDDPVLHALSFVVK